MSRDEEQRMSLHRHTWDRAAVSSPRHTQLDRKLFWQHGGLVDVDGMKATAEPSFTSLRVPKPLVAVTCSGSLLSVLLTRVVIASIGLVEGAVRSLSLLGDSCEAFETKVGPPLHHHRIPKQMRVITFNVSLLYLLLTRNAIASIGLVGRAFEKPHVVTRRL